MDPPHYVVWYGNDAKDWSFYVATFIDNTYGSTVHKHAIENLPLPLTDARVGPFKRTKVQIVILSPSFLEYIDNNPNILLGKLFEPSRVITIMCGVSEVDITSMHRANLISFDSWKIIKVTDKDPNFSPNFQSHIDEILQNANSISDCYQNKNQFKLHPCKVREVGNDIIIICFFELDTVYVAYSLYYTKL